MSTLFGSSPLNFKIIQTLRMSKMQKLVLFRELSTRCSQNPQLGAKQCRGICRTLSQAKSRVQSSMVKYNNAMKRDSYLICSCKLYSPLGSFLNFGYASPIAKIRYMKQTKQVIQMIKVKEILQCNPISISILALSSLSI